MDLKEIGLTEYEEKAYNALIELGKSTATEISRHSGVSYGKIYEVLASLERKGLVKIIPEKTKMFAPADPKSLMNLIDNKEKQLKQLRDKVKQMKQVYASREEEVVHIVKGKRNFYKLLREKKETKEFDYAIKYTSEYNPEWVRRAKKKLKQGVIYKVLTRYEKDNKKEVDKWLKIHKNIKKIENKGVAIGLTENRFFAVLIKHNIILSITDKNFINVMKILIENTYDNAKEIKD